MTFTSTYVFSVLPSQVAKDIKTLDYYFPFSLQLFSYSKAIKKVAKLSVQECSK